MIGDMEIPLVSGRKRQQDEDSCGTCGTKSCAAVRHIEDVAAELDQLRREVRQTERHHNEDIRKLWYKIGGLIVLLATVLPTGWASFLGLI